MVVLCKIKVGSGSQARVGGAGCSAGWGVGGPEVGGRKEAGFRCDDARSRAEEHELGADGGREWAREGVVFL